MTLSDLDFPTGYLDRRWPTRVCRETDGLGGWWRTHAVRANQAGEQYQHTLCGIEFDWGDWTIDQSYHRSRWSIGPEVLSGNGQDYLYQINCQRCLKSIASLLAKEVTIEYRKI